MFINRALLFHRDLRVSAFRLPASSAVAMVIQFLAALFCVAVIAGCRQDMHDQPSYSALEESSFFADNRSARVPVEGTVPRGQLRDDALLYTGKVNDEPAAVFPFA